MSFGKRFLENVEEAFARLIDQTAERLAGKARQKTPVDTGALRNGWEVVSSGEGLQREAVVKNDVPYAGFVEFGTSEQPAVGMLSLSIQEIKTGGG